METFEEIVKRCSADESKQVLSNASISHAHVLVDRLIRDAARHKEHIRIITGCLSKYFYDSLAGVAERALKSGCKIEVLVLKDDAAELEGNKFVNVLKAFPALSSLTVLNLNEDQLPHFIVVGAKRYRFETDDALKTAVACFNDDGVGSQLNKIYDIALDAHVSEPG